MQPWWGIRDFLKKKFFQNFWKVVYILQSNAPEREHDPKLA